MSKALRPGLPHSYFTVTAQNIKMSFLAAAFVVPLNTNSGWQILSFKKIASNKVQFGAQGMTVQVRSSASPIIYKLPEINETEKLTVKGRLRGQLKLRGKLGMQGAKGNDDFIFRLGLVVPGDKKLNFIQKKIAPQWVLQLHQLAPANSGVDRIEFFNLVSDKSLLGQTRKHPLTDLIVENFIWQLPNTKAVVVDPVAQTGAIDESATSTGANSLPVSNDWTDFNLEYKLPTKIKAAALWIAIDGDDTASDYEIEISSLRLN